MRPRIEQLEDRLTPAGLPALELIAAHWQESVSAWTCGDWTGDGRVNLADATAAGKAWGVDQAPLIASFDIYRYALPAGGGWQDDGGFLDLGRTLIRHERWTMHAGGGWVQEVLYG